MCHSALGRLLSRGGSRGPINVHSHTHSRNTCSLIYSDTHRGVRKWPVNVFPEESVKVAVALILLTITAHLHQFDIILEMLSTCKLSFKPTLILNTIWQNIGCFYTAILHSYLPVTGSKLTACGLKGDFVYSYYLQWKVLKWISYLPFKSQVKVCHT